MRTGRWIGAATVVLACVAETPGQFGIGFQYQGRRVRVSGFFGDSPLLNPYAPYPVVMAPYGAISSRVVTIVTPPARPLPRHRPGPTLEEETAGVDLDLVPVPERPAVEPPPKPAPPPPKAEPKLPGLPPAKADPIEENARLIELGLDAFRNQEYGLAALRFEQATLVMAEQPRSHFLLAQARFAIGKHRDAVTSIEAGMKRHPNWPRTPFEPRRDLYKGTELDFGEQLRRLEQVLEAHPDHATYLFLTAYMQWFDGRRAEAVRLLRRARPLAVDPTYIDAFLRAAQPEVAAVR